ncbi:MAG: hypothetical protein PHU85_14455 [Phycisphaerae bacterium]|nr:hypothetical protein [Phycisphaerae bacterium]
MRCPCQTTDPATAFDEAGRWAYFTRSTAHVTAEVVDHELVFSVLIGAHREYLAGKLVVHVIRQPKPIR